MSLLPKTFQDFSSKQYWNTFFAKRGEKAFEWYGEYTELCGLIHKYVKTSDNILVPGCGNSTLSADLYGVGYCNITNLDNSDVVIRQMRDKHQQTCPGMKWVKMDVCRMEGLDEGQFSCVLDKAALDALMTDDSTAVLKTADDYFGEVSRVLRVGGRFVCVSLLQEHILRHVLHWFPENGFMVRICRCEDAENSQYEAGNFSFPVFVVVCTKFKKMPNFKPMMEVQLDSEGSPQRVQCDQEVMDRVREVQQYAWLRHTMHTKSLAGESTSVQLCNPADGSPRYTLHIVDSTQASRPLKFAVFIVPLGREREWLFGSVKGREQLAESAEAVRLIVAHLHHSSGPSRTLQQIQDELSPKVMELAPQRLPSHSKVPFLSVGGEMGVVEEVSEGHSEHSGGFVVEDVHPPGAPPIRRLIFHSNRSVVQSEARILTGKSKEDRKKKKKKKGGGGGRVSVDHSHLCCRHHIAMVAGVTLSPPNSPILVVGLGGGPLATFIHANFPQRAVVAVELDAAMVDVAKQFFGFKADERMKVEVCDGLQYIAEAVRTGLKFGCILFDVDSKDTSVGMSCPPEAFLTPSLLGQVEQCLVDEGLLIVNLVCRDDDLRASVLSDLKATFSSVLVQEIPEEVNRVVHCLRGPGGARAQEMEARFKGSVGAFREDFRKRHDRELEDLSDLMEGVRVL